MKYGLDGWEKLLNLELIWNTGTCKGWILVKVLVWAC